MVRHFWRVSVAWSDGLIITESVRTLAMARLSAKQRRSKDSRVSTSIHLVRI